MTAPTAVKAKCSESYCDEPAKGIQDVCEVHYRQRYRGQPLRPFVRGKGRSIEERLWEKVDFGIAEDDCWLWTASLNEGGYGQFRVDDKRPCALAHRVSYELLVGCIAQGLDLDHLCRNPPCVNAFHLEPVTNAENLRRGLLGDLFVPQETCLRGHSRTIDNLYGNGYCKTCSREHSRRWRARTLVAHGSLV